MQELRIALAPATPLRLRLLGEKEEPLSGAEVRPVEHRNPGLLLDWKGETDEAGRVIWTNAPNTEVFFQSRIRTIPFAPLKSVRPGQSRSFTFAKMQISVLRSKSRPPTRTAANPSSNLRFGKLSSTEQFMAWGEAGKDGIFQKEFLAADLPRNMGNAFRVQVRTEGFAPWTSEMIYFDEGDQDITARPVKAQRPSGLVLAARRDARGQCQGPPERRARLVV